MDEGTVSAEQKRAEKDLRIISAVTLAVFVCYVATGDRLKHFVTNAEISPLWRLVASAAFQFGIAGLGITAVCVLRKEHFARFGLTKKNLPKAVAGTVLCFLPYIVFVFAAGRFEGYRPLHILITDDILALGGLAAAAGMALIALVWGFFEGFNYAVICDKINACFPSAGRVDKGAATCAVLCVLFHPFSISLPGIAEILTTLIAIYGMLIVKKKTGNAWGCVFAFCLIWNAF